MLFGCLHYSWQLREWKGWSCQIHSVTSYSKVHESLACSADFVWSFNVSQRILWLFWFLSKGHGRSLWWCSLSQSHKSHVWSSFPLRIQHSTLQQAALLSNLWFPCCVVSFTRCRWCCYFSGYPLLFCSMLLNAVPMNLLSRASKGISSDCSDRSALPIINL